MKAKSYPMQVRLVSLVLAALQLLGPAVPSIWALNPTQSAQAPDAGAGSGLAPQLPPATGLVPHPNLPSRVALTPHFSDAPTDSELFAAHIFAVPLVPVGRPDAVENKALAEALLNYLKRGRAEDHSIILAFMKHYPHSAWNASLLLNLGVIWRQSGYFSRALDAWQQAWNLSKDEKEYRVKAMADRALGEMVQLDAWSGQCDELNKIFAEIENRPLVGGATEMISGARQGLWIMDHDPGVGFLCGPYALQQIALATAPTMDLSKLAAAKSSRQGFSLDQLKDLADQVGIKLQIARRMAGAPIPLNSVIHWKFNHYGAILKHEGDSYLVRDATFSRLYGQELRLSQAALDEESSGYFLIPDGPMPRGWESVPANEARSVWGKVTVPCPNFYSCTSGPDQNAFTPYDLSSCHADPHNMAQASAFMMLVSLNVTDTPIGYQPPRGPAVEFTVSYNQRDPYSQANPNYSNLGDKWNFNWFTYIQDAGANGDHTSVTRYVGGGGAVPTTGYNPITGAYTQDREGAVLSYYPPTTFNITGKYQLLYPDGTTLIFNMASTVDANASSRQMFLSAIVDPSGQVVSIIYNDNGSINFIADATGQQTHFYYDSSDPYKITRVQDPFGRTAQFQYDLNGNLIKITDVIGMTSAFGYDANDFLNLMVTPYGASTFSTSDGNNAGGWYRSLLMTDPNGDQEYLLYENEDPRIQGSDTEAPPANIVTGNNLDNRFLDYRNTYYFGKEVMKQYGSGDVTKATIYHWMNDDDAPGAPALTSGILESVKAPLTSRVWFMYPGQTDSLSSSGTTLNQPSTIARVVDDPANPTQFVTQTTQIAYNNLGLVTKVDDPLGRETTLQYYPNGIDLQYVRQTTGTMNDLLAEFGAYDGRHRPSTYIDASRQTWNLAWNAYGQLTTVTDPLNEVTHYNYDANNNYLLSIGRDWSGGTKTTSLAYDAFGRVQTVTDSQGYALNYAYDALDRVTRVTYPDNSFQRYDYSRKDLVRAWDRSGYVTQATYDGVGRPLTVTDRLGQKTLYSWCGCGSLESITDPLGHTTSWTRDLNQRVIQKTYMDTSTEQYGYDSRSGRLISVTDAKNQVKHYAHNLDDSLSGVTYTDTSGNSFATPPVSFGYDSQYGRLISMTDGTGTTTYQYNSATGSLTTGAGQLSIESDPIDAGSAHDTSTITYSYDELGRQVLKIYHYSDQIHPGGSGELHIILDSIQFDTLGRVSVHNTPIGQFNLGYADDTAQVADFSYPNGLDTYFSYFGNTGDRRLQSINAESISGGYFLDEFQYQYDQLGRTKEVIHTADSSYASLDPSLGWTVADDKIFDYDAEGQLKGAWNPQTSANPTVANGFAYDYDAAGNRTREQHESWNYSSSSPNPLLVSQSAYNNVNQLQSRSSSGSLPVTFTGLLSEYSAVTINGAATVTTPSPQPTSIDPKGYPEKFTGTANFTTGSHPAAVVATDNNGTGGGNVTTQNHAVDVVGDVAKTFTYDNNGNCNGFTTPSSTVTYEWDAEDRLTAINNGNLRSEFTYDGFSRCVMIVEKNSGTVTSTKHFVWCGGQICQERDGASAAIDPPSGTTTTIKYFDPEGVLVSSRTGGSSGPTTSDSSYYYTRDNLGSIRMVTDSGDNVRAYYDYDPYGRQTKVLGDIDADFGYAGYYVHAPSGLNLTTFRAYDPDIGRWINRDPMGEAGGMNLYGYVGNNPINEIDPYGLAPWYSWLNPFNYSTGFANWQGQNAIQAQLGRAGYESIQAFQLDHPGYLGTITSGDMSAVQAGAGVAAVATTAYITLVTSATPESSVECTAAGKTIGLGLDRDLANHMGTGAITYRNGAWQNAGLTSVPWWRAWDNPSAFMRSFEESAENAASIRFDVSNFNPAFPNPGITQQELTHLLNTPSLLQKTTFIQNGQQVIWNGSGFVKP